MSYRTKSSLRLASFQPRPIRHGRAFFTTIPIAIGTTGQGTGLGLSLAYDIVKAHGGTIEVNSTESVGSEFIIILPIKNQ